MSWVEGKSPLQSLILVFLLKMRSFVLNPESRYYTLLKQKWKSCYEDNLWGEDALFLERNSRDSVSRVGRINSNAEAVCKVLLKHPRSNPGLHPLSSNY